MMIGWYVRRAFGPGSPARFRSPDQAKTQQECGLVQVVRPDQHFRENHTAKRCASESEPTNVGFPTNPSIYLDHLDQERDNKGLPGPGDGFDPDQIAPSLDQPAPCVGFCRYGAWCCPDHAGFALDAPPWHDDRGWIFRWCHAGTSLAEREPVLRAWLAAAPPQPLPRGLPAVELARIARQHGVVVEVEPCQSRTAEENARG